MIPKIFSLKKCEQNFFVDVDSNNCFDLLSATPHRLLKNIYLPCNVRNFRPKCYNIKIMFPETIRDNRSSSNPSNTGHFIELQFIELLQHRTPVRRIPATSNSGYFRTFFVVPTYFSQASF
jgi:hypothetical protein